MTLVAIGLGSNLGERVATIERAAAALNERFEDVRLSPLYETAPMYDLDQPPFVNAVALLRTHLGPYATLQTLKSLECELGREPRRPNGPREIDLDLIAYGRLTLRSRGSGLAPLTLPHPRAFERRFVLQPLVDLDPTFEIVGFGRVAELLNQTLDQDVRRNADAAISLHRD